jgi:hypothetical protein
MTVWLRGAVGGLALLTACDGGDQAPGPIPQIAGVYTGLWTMAVENDRVSCPAALTIRDQTDSVFSTTFELLRRDVPGIGCVDLVQEGTGIVRSTGAVSALAGMVTPVTCRLEQTNRGLSGRVAGDSIMLTGRYTYQCERDYTWTYGFSGSTTAGPLPSYPDLHGTFSGTWTTVVANLQVTCPVTVSIDSQERDQVAGAYTLGQEGTCIAQPAAGLSGVLTIDGALTVSGTPPVPVGCSVHQELGLSGEATGGALDLTGMYALLCGGSVREFAVLLAVTRD